MIDRIDIDDKYISGESARRRALIFDFAKKNGFSLHKKILNDNNLWLIDGLSKEMPRSKLETYTHFATQVVYKNAECARIAGEAVGGGIVTGILQGDRVNQYFVQAARHWINYDTIPDGSVAAIDFTAGHTIDLKEGNFDILTLRMQNLSQLLEAAGKLYGGVWSEFSAKV